MNVQILKGLTNNLIISLQTTKTNVLTEIVTAVAIAELEETITKMLHE